MLVEIIQEFLILFIVLNGFYYMFTGKFTLFGIDKMLKSIIKSLLEGIIGLVENMVESLGEIIASLKKKFFQALKNRKEKEAENND
jgi:hypothetical protein